MLLNRILRWLGLMKISRARYINRIIHAEYERWIGEEARSDFGAILKPTTILKDEAETFANDIFNRLVAHDEPNVQVQFGKTAGDV